MALSLYHKKPPEGGPLLITSDGGTCKPYALFCLDGTSIVSQIEQHGRVRAAKAVCHITPAAYSRLDSGWKVNSAASNAVKHTIKLISITAKT